MTVTWTCKCKNAQLRLREIRMITKAGTGEEVPIWVYECPQCPVEAVAVSMEPVSSAPKFSWLADAEGDDTEMGGRVATAEEAAALGDILADNTARDERGERVVWQ